MNYLTNARKRSEASINRRTERGIVTEDLEKKKNRRNCEAIVDIRLRPPLQYCSLVDQFECQVRAARHFESYAFLRRLVLAHTHTHTHTHLTALFPGLPE